MYNALAGNHAPYKPALRPRPQIADFLRRWGPQKVGYLQVSQPV
jgi:hypothetical protein